jgi:hypothetical protein
MRDKKIGKVVSYTADNDIKIRPPFCIVFLLFNDPIVGQEKENLKAIDSLLRKI